MGESKVFQREMDTRRQKKILEENAALAKAYALLRDHGFCISIEPVSDCHYGAVDITISHQGVPIVTGIERERFDSEEQNDDG